MLAGFRPATDKVLAPVLSVAPALLQAPLYFHSSNMLSLYVELSSELPQLQVIASIHAGDDRGVMFRYFEANEMRFAGSAAEFFVHVMEYDLATGSGFGGGFVSDIEMFE